jgi:hypothetical protein
MERGDGPGAKLGAGMGAVAALARRLGTAVLLGLALQGLIVTAARAVPSFAVQTGQPCQACHVGGFGPQLTPFGREFKMRGYTTRSVNWTVPVSAMAEGSYVSTAKGQPGGAAPGYGANDNFSLDQFSIFLAGGLGSHLGAFIQTTYDGVAKAWHWDNLDVRAVTTATIKGMSAVFGVSVNNAPTVQDAWNTLPAWGYPYTSSALAPAPGAGPIIGSLAQNTLGVTGYVWLDSQFYIEAGGYQSPGAGFLTHAGIDPTDPGSIAGTAPYARFAWQKNYGDRNFEVGAFALNVDINPGLDMTTGTTDRYTDLGLDASYQLFASHGNAFTANARYTHEQQDLRATQALGGSANAHETLEDLRFDASYYWHNKVGLTVGAFDTWGSSDPVLYAANAIPRPNSSGLLFQLDGTPWGAGGSPLGPRFNMRVGVQYTDYLSFNGAASDYDGFGRNAGDNNTFRVFTWIAY